MSVCIQVILLLLPSVIFASHFLGGSVTFSYKEVLPSGSYKLEIRAKDTFTSAHCSTSFPWNTCSGSCGNVTSDVVGQIYSTGSRNPDQNWCQTERVMTRVIPSGSFRLRQSGGNWVALANSWASQDWRLLTVVNLGKRSDTNKPNSSPVTTSISFVRVPRNCPRTYKLITFDPDGDQGRCRYGVFVKNECVGCTIPAGFALGQTTINQKDFCTLSYTSVSVLGMYGFEVVVEDFPRQTIILSHKIGVSSIGIYSSSATPLSRIPLQFAVKVEADVSSCEEGVYLPKFIAPTPANGETIPAVINQQCEIIVSATASASSIHALLISGPLNITVNNYGGSSTQFVLRWTPRTEDLGGYFPVCFVAESNQPSTTFYQSDMRCVLIEVGDGTASDPQPTDLDPPANIVVGMRMVVKSTLDLTDESQSEIFIRQFQEELIKRGLPNSTTVRLRTVYQRDP